MTTITVQGKHALITGAGSGINLCFARMLLEKGCSVLIADLKLQPEAEELLKKYPFPTADGQAGAFFQKTNVASWPELSSMWKTAVDKFSSVDIVVAGAGLFEPKWASFWEAPKTESNPDTVSVDPADADPGHYDGFVRSLGGLRDELGIRVGCVAPGAVRTPLWHDDPTKAVMLDKDTVLIEPEEIAQGMWQLVVNEKLGDGTILEVTKGATRVVPLFNAPVPTGEGILVPGYAASMGTLYEKLRNEGLSV